MVWSSGGTVVGRMVGWIVGWAGRIVGWVGRIVGWVGRIVGWVGPIVGWAGWIVGWAGRIVGWGGRIAGWTEFEMLGMGMGLKNEGLGASFTATSVPTTLVGGSVGIGGSGIELGLGLENGVSSSASKVFGGLWDEVFGLGEGGGGWFGCGGCGLENASSNACSNGVGLGGLVGGLEGMMGALVGGGPTGKSG